MTKQPSEWAERRLAQMVESIKHEAFYTSGTWSDVSLGVYCGWAARVGSFSDCMPLENERRDVVLVFAGEEFPDPGLVNTLRGQGHEIKPGRADYLVHWAEQDPAFPRGLNGRFQGILIRKEKGTALLFNDRYGMQRIYVHRTKDAVYFAVEAKAILAACPEARELDLQGMSEFLSCGTPLENRTLLRQVAVLPAGSAWLFSKGQLVEEGQYFQATEWESQEPLTEASYYPELRETFARILPRYFNGGEHIGMSLTGGLDTRMIMAWQPMPPGSLRCYTFGGMFRDCRDVVVAREVASACGQPHSVIPVVEDFVSQFPHLAERSVYLTDGGVDVSRAPDLYVSKIAREIAPVRIAGTYGSEVLRRVIAYKPTVPKPGVFTPEIVRSVVAVGQTYSKMRQAHAVSFAAFLPAPQRGVDALERSQFAIHAPFLDNDLVRAAFRCPETRAVANDRNANGNVCLRLIRDGNEALAGIRTDRGLAGRPGIMQTVARGWLEFSFKAEYAYDYGMPDWMARIDNMLSPLRLENLFLGWHKFYHFRVWYRDRLSGYLREMILDERTLSRPYLNRQGVQSMLAGHLSGAQNYTSEIHKVLTLELFHRLFLDA